MKKAFLLLSLIISCGAFAQKDNKINIGHLDTLYSKILGEKRDYLVHLPQGYYNAWFQQANYPVIFLLDGYGHFNYVAGMVDFLVETGKIPPMIVIAIPNTNRTRDLTPSQSLLMPNGEKKDWLKESGGGAKFLSFMKDELIPHIDSAYRTDKYRIFIGHSFGGIAVINGLLTIPQTFNAYIAIDPSLWWDNQLMLKGLTKKLSRPGLKDKYFFLAQANNLKDKKLADTSDLHTESLSQMATYLQTRNISELNWQHKYYENENHGSVPFTSTYDGLRFIFEGYDSGFKYYRDPISQWKKRFAEFSEKHGFTFLPTETMFNEFGWEALFGKEYVLAYQYFQFNIENFPKSCSAIESMASYWKEKGDKKKAISFYEKCLKLSPGNKHLIEEIDKLK